MVDFNALLVLEDGRRFPGRAIGTAGDALGEAVFNTSMGGYQEIATDPSYTGQIIVFTAPQIGNYGISPADSQTPKRDQARVAGVVVRELSEIASNWRSEASFGAWLADQGVSGISEVDTRALTRHLRDRGSMRAGIFRIKPPQTIESLSDSTLSGFVERVRGIDPMEGRDLAAVVSTSEAYRFDPSADDLSDAEIISPELQPPRRLVVVDLGVKRGILASLSARGFILDVVPARTPAEAILETDPAGVVFSNGPGDPAPLNYAIESARALIAKVPVLGICLGFQVLALALGGRTFKLLFGHHGGNHPVKDLKRGDVWITAQNHGFAVDPDSLPKDEVEVSHVSLYDQTLEGFIAPQRRLLAVQFHPEAGPGPSDASPIFDRFVEMIDA